ncbi:hypothetical protein ABZP36_017551 [Zizania latifolia]
MSFVLGSVTTLTVVLLFQYQMPEYSRSARAPLQFSGRWRDQHCIAGTAAPVSAPRATAGGKEVNTTTATASAPTNHLPSADPEEEETSISDPIVSCAHSLGLAWGTDDQSLRDAFSSFGDVTEARVITDRETGRSRGFGFVNFSSDDDAKSAIEGMDGKELQGRSIRVNFANDRPSGNQGFGGGGGYGGGGYGGGNQGYGGQDAF